CVSPVAIRSCTAGDSLLLRRMLAVERRGYTVVPRTVAIFDPYVVFIVSCLLRNLGKTTFRICLSLALGTVPHATPSVPGAIRSTCVPRALLPRGAVRLGTDMRWWSVAITCI